MKKVFFSTKMLLLALVFSTIGQYAVAQSIFWQDDFENAATPEVPAGSTRTPENNSGTGGPPNTSYFRRAASAADISLTAAFGPFYTGLSGSNLWAGEDHDTPFGVGNEEQQIEWTNINISGKTGLSFKGLFAANNTNGPWDNSAATGGIDPPGPNSVNDYIIVEYAIDAGAYIRLILFSGDNVTPAPPGKSMREDTNGDGVGDGTQLNINLAEFTKTIAGTGTTMKIRLRVQTNGSNEEWAVDNFRLTNLVLPVALIRFTALPQGNKVHLNWTTASEKDQAYFEVERSADGELFSSLAQLKGAGTTNNTRYYAFVDEKPLPGVGYYRLKQVDNQGTFSYSNTVSARTTEEAKITIYPSHTSGEVSIRSNLIAIQRIDVFNSMGQLVLTRKTSQEPGEVIRLNLTALPTGSYCISIKTAEGKIVRRVSKD